MPEGFPGPRNSPPLAMGEEQGLFSSAPRSFKMDRKSPQACRLKASVSQKLEEFLGNYTDNVLAEYIVVLVCNGKHQNQARDDLEAFLGDESGKFVAWLWHHLSEEICLLKTTVVSSNFKANVPTAHGDDVVKGYKTDRSTDLQNHSSRIFDMQLCKDETYGPLAISPNANPSNAIEISEDFQHWCPGVGVSSAEVNTEGSQIQTCKVHGNHGVADNNLTVAAKHRPSKVMHSSEADGDQCLQIEDQYQKITKTNSNGPPRQPWLSQKREPVSKNLQSVITDDPHSRPLSMNNVPGGRLSSRSEDAVKHQLTKTRGNVWDRLGKPCEDNNVMVQEKVYRLGADVAERKKMNNLGEGLDKHRLMGVLPGASLSRRLMGHIADNSCSKVMPNKCVDKYEIAEHSSDTVETCNIAVNTGKKRQFGWIDSGNGLASLSNHRDYHLQDKRAYDNLQRSSTAKPNSVQSLSEAIADDSLFAAGAACHSLKSVNATFNPSPHKISQYQLNREASVVTPVQTLVPVSSAKPTSLSYAGGGNASHRPVQDEVLDMKLRLLQVEREMLSLRSKQAKKSNDCKLNASLGSGVQKTPEEDVESRTVFVTNVHFAASEEAVSSHFTTCGVVVKVILLTDAITGQPKGSAFITFANKESADKAILLSGTSFFSRTLKVMRKTDMPAGILRSIEPAGKPPQPWYPSQSHWKGTLQRQYSSSHLQWKRDQLTSGENTLSAPMARELEASSTAE